MVIEDGGGGRGGALHGRTFLSAGQAKRGPYACRTCSEICRNGARVGGVGGGVGVGVGGGPPAGPGPAAPAAGGRPPAGPGPAAPAAGGRPPAGPGPAAPAAGARVAAARVAAARGGRGVFLCAYTASLASARVSVAVRQSPPTSFTKMRGAGWRPLPPQMASILAFL